jgi:hypothetical protein
MAFIDLDRLHPKVWQLTFIHKEVQGSDEISQIRINADVIIKSCFEMQNIVLIALPVDVLDRHLRVEELIEI